jgi:hypothetical protein
VYDENEEYIGRGKDSIVPDEGNKDPGGEIYECVGEMPRSIIQLVNIRF